MTRMYSRSAASSRPTSQRRSAGRFARAEAARPTRRRSPSRTNALRGITLPQARRRKPPKRGAAVGTALADVLARGSRGKGASRKRPALGLLALGGAAAAAMANKRRRSSEPPEAVGPVQEDVVAPVAPVPPQG